MTARSPDVFVVRIWFERAAANGSRRRGYVEHVASRQRRYFLELEDALDFVAALSALPFRPASASLQQQGPVTDAFDRDRNERDENAVEQRVQPSRGRDDVADESREGHPA
jgi:hypothetical protein